MSTGNTAAISVSQASMATAPAASDCKELEDKNSSSRTHVDDNSGDQRLVNKNGLDMQEGTTVSSCKMQPKGGDTAICATAHSNGRAQEMFPSRFISGGKSDVRSGEAPVMCSDKHTHKKPCVQKSGHAEARIFDAIGRKKALKLVFKIDWINGKGQKSNLPCPACQRLMCIAMKDCKHEIWICNDKDQPKKLTQQQCESDKDGNVTERAREALVTLMRTRPS